MGLALAVAQTTDSGVPDASDPPATTSNPGPEPTDSPKPTRKPRAKRCGKVSMKLDTDKDGIISFDEIAAALPADKPQVSNVAYATFFTADVNQDNSVDQEEIDGFVATVGCKKPERKMFRKIYK